MNNLKHQIGCGYCLHEKKCKKRKNERKNHAKEGCKDYKHFKNK